MPRNHSMRAALSDCISGVKTAILGAPLNNCQPNIPPMVEAAGEDLVTLQRDRVIVIKPSDKTGSTCILNFEDYTNAMGEKLKQTYVAPDGSVKPKFVKVTKKTIAEHHAKIKDLVAEGVDRGFITPEDAALMVPDVPTPDRLYGLVKDHKPINPETGIPDLREVISGSGTNTEMVSAYVDHYAKKYVTDQEMHLEDTADALRLWDETH